MTVIYQTEVIKQGNDLIQVKVNYQKIYSEYQCKVYVNGLVRTQATYYTPDETDALSTAKRMLFDYNPEK
jgi:hypothetical protein